MSSNSIILGMQRNIERNPLTLAIVNDFPENTGIFSYSLNLFKSMLLSSFNPKMFHFYSGCFNIKEPNIVGVKGISFPTRHSLEINKLTGLNYHFLKNVTGSFFHFSSPSLYKLVRDKSKSIITLHDLYYLENYGRSRIMSRYYKKVYFKLKNGYKIIADSDFTKNLALQNLGIDLENIATVWPGIDLSLFSPSKLGKSPFDYGTKNITILHVGYDSPNKNISTLLDVMYKLPDNFNLIRVGWNSSKTIKEVTRLRLGNRVKLLGSISRDELLSLYKKVDMFVFPSTYEGFGIPPIEAMASGIPTVVTDVASLPEVTKGGALIVSPDSSSIVEGILKTVDPTFAKTLILNGIKVSRKFSLEAQFLRLREAYKTLMDLDI